MAKHDYFGKAFKQALEIEKMVSNGKITSSEVKQLQEFGVSSEAIQIYYELLCPHSSIGSECQASTLDVGGSNPSGDAKGHNMSEDDKTIQQRTYHGLKPKEIYFYRCQKFVFESICRNYKMGFTIWNDHHEST